MKSAVFAFPHDLGNSHVGIACGPVGDACEKREKTDFARLECLQTKGREQFLIELLGDESFTARDPT